MANLEKLKEQSRKFELKGQWAKAIDPLVKAIEEFEKSPEDDAELTLYTKTAELYQKVGDSANAVAYFERAVDKYNEAGLVNQAIALCNKVLRLSPGRASLYLKLGMLFAKKGFAGEAKQNLLEYASRMQKAGQIEEAFKALKKFAEMTPGQDDIWKVLSEQARAAAATPEAKEQVEKLLTEFEAKDRQAQRKSRMSRSMITGELIPEEPAGPKKGELIFLDVGDVPLPPGARKSGAMVAPPPEPPPKPKAPPAPKAPPPPAPKAPPPPPPPAPKPPADIPLLAVEPEPAETPAAEPPLREPEPELASADEALVIEPTSLAIEPTSLVIEPTSLAIEPTSLDFEPTSMSAEPPAPPEAPLETLDLGEIEAVAEPVVEPEPVAEPESLELEPTPEAEEGLPLMDLEAPSPAEVAAEESAAAQSLEFMDLGVVTAAGPSAQDLEARIAVNPEDWDAHRLFGEALIEQGERERGLGELDAALAGFDGADQLEEAFSICEEVLRLEPNSVRHQQKRVELAYRQGDRARLVDAYVELADALLRSNDPEKAIAVYQRVLEHDPENARAKSAIETLAPPAPPQAAAPSVRAPAAPVGGDYVDLGAMLLEDEDGPKDLRMRIQDEEPTGDEQKDFQQMLAAFKKGIEANVGEEDFQSHYDLGVAYREMGLLDEAIAEFQKALRAADGRLKSSEALGLCFFEKGQFAVAETILRRGLDLPARSDAERIGLLYWLGRALEDQSKARDALDAYNRVFAVDINFADVNQRVQALAQAT